MNSRRAWLRCVRYLGTDAVIAGACLCVFALFHHVLPRAATEAPLAVIPTAGVDSAQVATAAPTQGVPAVESADVATDVATTASSRGGKQGRGSISTKGGGSSSKGGSALTETDTTVVTTAAAAQFPSEKFAAMFTSEAVTTDTSYSDSGLSVTVTQQEANGAVYYLANIYLADVTRLQTVLAGQTYGTGYRDSITDMASLSYALLAVNGDYYGNTNEGVVIRNGIVYRANATSCDVCVLYQDGTMRTMAGASFSLTDAVADGAWQAWTFGPALLDGSGAPIVSFASTGHILTANPRTAIGYYEPGHYCLVVVDGRGQNGSEGLTLTELSNLFASLGCKAAYNLDGGNSSVMVWQNEVANSPSGGGRESSDCIVLTK